MNIDLHLPTLRHPAIIRLVPSKSSTPIFFRVESSHLTGESHEIMVVGCVKFYFKKTTHEKSTNPRTNPTHLAFLSQSSKSTTKLMPGCCISSIRSGDQNTQTSTTQPLWRRRKFGGFKVNMKKWEELKTKKMKKQCTPLKTKMEPEIQLRWNLKFIPLTKKLIRIQHHHVWVPC